MNKTDKPEKAEVERVDQDGVFTKEGAVKRDYSGAHEKTDPAEIALVKKLDWYIMPILWLMYWLNYLVRYH